MYIYVYIYIYIKYIYIDQILKRSYFMFFVVQTDIGLKEKSTRINMKFSVNNSRCTCSFQFKF